MRNILFGLLFLFQFLGLNAQDYPQIGMDLLGTEAGAVFGKSIALNENGSRMVVMANLRDGNGNPPVVGAVVRMYGFDNNQWTQLGDDLILDKVGSFLTNSFLPPGGNFSYPERGAGRRKVCIKGRSK